ncbi:MAG: bifunctional folylpolyglutamate synthase/dihydrofolate synthase [Bacteroidales bacterium]|nr:bifunctional folylpolyglutamate synthase/dihydrofolate synthase [Bacteroidales bacterium]
MNYSQTIEYMYAQLPMFHRVGASAYKADLNNTIALCNLLGNPQEAFTTIHIAGTNGKGSVSNMIASILQTKGLKTGLYTSPHLKDFRERIRINGKMIDKRYVSRFISRYQSSFESIHPSFFELTMAMAFQYFKDQKTDIAVIETGLGGRLDSTNIITPLLTAITNVSFDHMQFLGDTLEKIAIEKAGIIKPSIPVVIGETQPEIKTVFQEKAKDCNAPILFADELFNVIDLTKVNPSLPENYLPSLMLEINRDGKRCIPILSSPLTGWYQRKNIVTVMAVCETMNSFGFGLTYPIIRNGIENVIKNTGFAGRWQVLGNKPLTLCDTGHNEGGLREVVAQLAVTPHQKLHWVFGVVNDKDLNHILKLLPPEATYYFCKPDIPRGLNAEILMGKAHAAGLKGQIYPSVKAALKAARQQASPEDLVFVGGSTFVVAEVI